MVINPDGARPRKAQLAYFTILEGNKMTAIIFFGGMVAGFLVGWISLALLTLASRSNREEERALVYNELAQSRPENG